MTHPPKSRSVRLALSRYMVANTRSASPTSGTERYRVLSATNLLTPAPGNVITAAAAQALIDDGVKVTILPPTAKQ